MLADIGAYHHKNGIMMLYISYLHDLEILCWKGYITASHLNRVPTRTGKPGKMGRHFPVREKSGNFEQTGKVRENHTKYWKTEIN